MQWRKKSRIETQAVTCYAMKIGGAWKTLCGKTNTKVEQDAERVTCYECVIRLPCAVQLEIQKLLREKEEAERKEGREVK